MLKELDETGEVLRQRCIFVSIGLRPVVFKKVTADADKVHTSLPKQDTGGSDALCLRNPPAAG